MTEKKGRVSENTATGTSMDEAVAHHRAGRLDQAEDIYRKILATQSDHFDARHLSGLAAHQRGDHETAIERITEAIQQAPGEALFHINLGNALKALGRLEDAVGSYEEALRMTPDYAEAHITLGLMFIQLGRLDDAMASCRKALAIKPDFAAAHNNLGIILQEKGRLEDAAKSHQKALELDPEYKEAAYNLGNALKALGRLDDAVVSFERALAIDPGYAEALSNMGIALKDMGRLEDAVAAYENAIAVKPDFTLALNNLGIAFKDLGRLKDSVESYERALAINPEYAEALGNMGNALVESGRRSDAVASYRKALAITPDYVEALSNLGALYNQMGRKPDAAASLRKALAINPDHAGAHYNLGNALELDGQLAETLDCYREAARLDADHQFAPASLLHQLQHTCAWREFKNLEADVDAAMQAALDQGRKVAVTPFALVARRGDGALNLAVAKAASGEAAKQMAGLDAGFSFSERQHGMDKPTIGYLSADFHNHATAHLTRGLFEHHDREAFRILAFSHGPDDGSDYRRDIDANCDGFLDISGDSHPDAAKRIFEAGVDILIDLKGYTEHNRLQIFALRPAPVQATYLGFPGTTGAAFMDYILTDAIVTPAGDTPYYAEAFVTLPHSYQATDNTQKISNAVLRRSDFGLPDDGFVFCSFNAAFKIDPAMFGVWMRLLDSVPGSVLWLLKSNDLAVKNLKAEAEARGIDADRLVFADMTPKDLHLARHRLADLALDTRVYGGHTTTTDALWAGLPVIALEGPHFASRVSSSLLQAVGLPELVSHSLEDYEAVALKLAQGPAELKAVAETLAKNRGTEPLFDTPRFTRNLEAAYKKMWEQYLSGDAPAAITVKEG